MNKRIAIIFEEDIYCQRGMFNAIRNRIKHLKDITDCSIDVYVIGYNAPWYIRKLRHTEKKEKISSIVLDGITYKLIWNVFTITDYLLDVKLNKSPFFKKIFYRLLERRFQGYDLISSHSINCGLLASRISKRDGIPFTITWHGSDIHTSPFVNKSTYDEVKHLLNTASCNFFVSKNLLSIGLTIAPNMNCEVLYNGRNEMFCRYTEDMRNSLRQQFGVQYGSKVVAFVGNLAGVKNPHLLAPIFSAIQKKYDKALFFWVIGSGKMEKDVKDGCEKLGVKCTFWGGQPADKMPDFMNCIDVLVLPSRNEGLPLVVVEAIASGANVVGSNVGGISEAIGNDNVISHGDDFIDLFSDRVVYFLNHKITQTLSEQFEWKNTAKKEMSIYNQLLYKQ